jgi:ArsR family transcriptional regulator, lead/cadmium/zinc/bismuth-responsive transcriptional repressor
MQCFREKSKGVKVLIELFWFACSKGISDMTTKTLPAVSDRHDIPCFDRKRVKAARKIIAEEEDLLPALVDLYKLLGNAARLKILLTLRLGELCVCDLANVLNLSVPATSHQLKLLRVHGWVRMRNDGKMVYYQLDNEGLRTALEGDLALLRSRIG